MGKVVINLKNGFNYVGIDEIDDMDWIYQGKFFNGNNDDLLLHLKNNNLIKDEYIYIPAGEYEVVELHHNDWNFNVGDFTITVVPDFDNDPSDPEVLYSLLYNNGYLKNLNSNE